MTASDIVGPLMVTADRFVISTELGANSVAFYILILIYGLYRFDLPGAAIVWVLRVGSALIVLRIFSRQYGLISSCETLVARASRT